MCLDGGCLGDWADGVGGDLSCQLAPLWVRSVFFFVINFHQSAGRSSFLIGFSAFGMRAMLMEAERAEMEIKR